MKIDPRFQSSRRDKFKIVADILAIAKHGTSKTRIMYRANLSHLQLKTYLGFLLSRKLLVFFSEGRRFVTTSKGAMYMKTFQHFEVMASSLTSEMEVLHGLVAREPAERKEPLSPHQRFG